MMSTETGLSTSGGVGGDSRRTGLRRYAGYAALVSAVAWLAKFFVILLNEGRPGTEDVEGSLFVVGGVALLVAVAITAWASTAHRHAAARALAVVGSVVAVFLLLGALEEAFAAWIKPEDGTAGDELALLVFALPALVLGLLALRRRADG